MVDARISPDMAIDIARRVGLIEDARDEANGDLKQAWADAREQFKAAGLSGAEIASEVAQLKGAIAETRLDDKAKQKRSTKAEGVGGYLEIITGPRARARARADRSPAATASQAKPAATTADGADEVSSAEQSTAPRSDVGDNSTEASGHGQRLDPAAATTPPAGETPPVDTNPDAVQPDPVRNDGKLASGVGTAGEASAPAFSAAPIHEPQGASIGAKPSMASEPATEEGTTSPQPSSVVPGRQPRCLNPDTCAGTWRKRCASCERAFMAVAAGGQAIEHQGQVA